VTTAVVEVVEGQGGLGGEKSWFYLSEKQVGMMCGVYPQKLDSVGMGLGLVLTFLLLNQVTFHHLQRIPLKQITAASHHDYCFEFQTAVGLQADSFLDKYI
jgi:hypothetical protein